MYSKGHKKVHILLFTSILIYNTSNKVCIMKAELTKTSFPSVYYKFSKSLQKQYIVRFKHLGKRYPDKNFTTLFGATTAKQASNMLYEIKSALSKGEDPFKKHTKTTVDDYFDRYITTIRGKDTYIKQTYYDKHIKPLIGKTSIEDVEEKHILKILNSKTLKDLSHRTKYTTKMILDPIFKRSIKDDKRLHNPLDDIKFQKTTEKKALQSRLVDNYKDVAHSIYNDVIKIEDINMRIFLLIALMTARRRGEILKLQWENIYNNKVFAPSSATKTNINDEYPLPTEVTELLKSLDVEKTGDIFTFKKDRPTRNFTALIKKSDIQLVKDENFTLHDTRHLFMSIMSNETNNPILVDKCISHANKSIMDTYLSFTYENRKVVFEQYWEILRG